MRRGVGLSFFFHGAGFTGAGEELLQAKVVVELRDGGGALVRTASTEFGQGTLTLLRALAAEALDLDPDAVDVALSDTNEVPGGRGKRSMVSLEATSPRLANEST